MTRLNFAFINRPPSGQKVDADGYDICFFIIGALTLPYEDLTISKLSITTPYSIELGFVMLPKGKALQHILKWLMIPMSRENGDAGLSFGVIGEALLSTAFPQLKIEDPIISPITLFRKDALSNFVTWHAKVKPYSWMAQQRWDLDAPIIFPPTWDGAMYESYFVILVGGPPTIPTTIPIYVQGQLEYK